MKKAFLFRVFTLTFFCLAALSIKSETSSNKVVCAYAASKATTMQPLMSNEVHEDPLSHDDGFFIKI